MEAGLKLTENASTSSTTDQKNDPAGSDAAKSDAIKTALYGAISDIGEDNIASLLRHGASHDVINTLTSNVKEHLKVPQSGYDALTLATATLHYILTVSLIPSQRKIDCRGIAVDIAIPDLKTLMTDPRQALIIQIINHKTVPDMSSLQPYKKNIWLISPHQIAGYRTFVIGANFADIILAIQDFLEGTGSSSLKILRV